MQKNYTNDFLIIDLNKVKWGAKFLKRENQ